MTDILAVFRVDTVDSHTQNYLLCHSYLFLNSLPRFFLDCCYGRLSRGWTKKVDGRPNILKVGLGSAL